jgi:hypothetical protein
MTPSNTAESGWDVHDDRRFVAYAELRNTGGGATKRRG